MNERGKRVHVPPPQTNMPDRAIHRVCYLLPDCPEDSPSGECYGHDPEGPTDLSGALSARPTRDGYGKRCETGWNRRPANGGAPVHENEHSAAAQGITILDVETSAHL